MKSPEMGKKVSIWVDDLRPAPKGFIWCKTFKSAIATIEYYDTCEFIDGFGIRTIDLDHDLGEDKSGYDVAKFIVENHISLESFYCHSMNPVGKKNIEQLLSHYGYKLK